MSLFTVSKVITVEKCVAESDNCGKYLQACWLKRGGFRFLAIALPILFDPERHRIMHFTWMYVEKNKPPNVRENRRCDIIGLSASQILLYAFVSLLFQRKQRCKLQSSGGCGSFTFVTYHAHYWLSSILGVKTSQF